MITIRRAAISDTQEISHLGKKTFDQSYGTYFDSREVLTKYLDISFSLEKIENSLKNSRNLYWLVYDTETQVSVGYAKLKLDSPTDLIKEANICKLQRIYLLQGYESRGIGSRLHTVIFNTARQNGYSIMWLSNLKLKQAAVDFYQKKGYTIAGEHQFTIGNETFDFWLMTIKLS